MGVENMKQSKKLDLNQSSLVNLVLWFVAIMLVICIRGLSLSIEYKTLLIIFSGVLVWFLYKKMAKFNRFSLEQVKPNKKIDNIQLLLFVALGVLFQNIRGMISNFLMNGEHVTNDKNIKANIKYDVPDYLLNSVTMPVIEEVVFRGYMFILAYLIATGINKLMNKHKENKQKLTFRLSIIIFFVLSIIFALGHMPPTFKEFSLFYYSAILYGVLYLVTRRLIVTICVHVINNTMAFVSLLYPKYVMDKTGVDWIVTITLIIIIILMLCFYQPIKRWIANNMIKETKIKGDKQNGKR